ncbi:MAG: AsmA family protein [Deltaproteobacteria bacterium]|nr:AsmA family protein [Deltaproteobacteria bacterium]
MKSYIKYGAVSIAILLSLLTLTVILLPLLINVQQYIPEIEEKISQKTGRQFSIGRDMSISVFPWIGLSCSNLRLGNSPGFGGGEFLEIEFLEARLKILPLLKRQIQISRFIIDGLEINLEKKADGKGNYHFDGWDKTGQDLISGPSGRFAGSFMKQLAVPIITVTNGHIIWNDFSRQNSHEITDVALQLSDVSLRDPFVADFSGDVDGKPVSFEGSIGSPVQYFEQGVCMIDLKFMFFDNLTAFVKGRFENSGQKFSYSFSLDIPPFSPKVVLADVGGDVSIMTAYPQALNTLAINTEVKGTRDSIVFEDGVAELDDSHLDFSCFINGFTEPDIRFAVKVDSIDLTGYFRQGEEKFLEDGVVSRTYETGGKYSALYRFGVAGTILADEIQSHGGTLSDVMIQLKGKDGLFTVDPLSFSLYQGQIESKITLDIRQNRPVSSLALKAVDVNVGPMLDDFFNSDILQGRAKADIKVSAFGDSILAIKESLKGQGLVRLHDGALVGYDLVGVAGHNKIADQRTIKTRPRIDFTELTIPITVKDGIVESRQTEIKSPVIRMMVTGSTDLVNEKFDLKVTADRKILLIEQGIGEAYSLPLAVAGTFSDVLFESEIMEVTGVGREERYGKIDVNRLVDEKLPTPVGEDLKNLVGKSLVDPEVVVQRFGLQPENIRKIKEKKKFRQGTGKIQIAPLREGSFLQL